MILRLPVLCVVALASVAIAADRVIINEVYFDPAKKQPFEFVELFNAGDTAADLEGWKLEDFRFQAGHRIEPGGYAVIACDPASFEKAFGIKALGQLDGGLKNEGEKLTMKRAGGAVVDQFTYAAGFPWPAASAGLGSSIERVHPDADPTQPGSWRASGFPDRTPGASRSFISAGSDRWRWRKGTREASEPRAAWRHVDFHEDDMWRNGKAGFGYGDEDDATVIGDMPGRYSSLFLRHRFEAAKTSSSILLRVRVDDGCIVWLNGREIARLHMSRGDVAFDALAEDHEAREWEEISVPADALVAGPNLLAAQVFNSARDSSDLSFDLELKAGASSSRPTPGARNSVAADTLPIACQDVSHSPAQPREGEPITIAASFATNPRVAKATTQVQIVEPGAYVRKADPAYEQGWQDLAMSPDVNGIYRCVLPAELSRNRHLIRYRIVAEANGTAPVRLPYPDDPSPNFACYVWNGPAPWTAALQPGKTAPLTFSPVMQRTLPTFTLIARADDVQRSQYDGGFHKRRFTGTFVFDGRVYDHMEFNNRGSASTYVSGKNKWGFHFPATHELAMRDQWGRPFERTWDGFAMNACASPWVQINRGMTGLDEIVSARAYELAGVPVSNVQPIQFRVVCATAEQGTKQYECDTWGVYAAMEDLDGAWIDNHELPDDVIWKPEDGLKHAPRGGQDAASALWNEFAGGPKGSSGDAAQWWRNHMDLPSYYSFHALNRLVSNVDIRPGANHAFYHHPMLGWQPIPWDLDMMFIPRSHQPGFIDQIRCLDVKELRVEYQNRAREILDLLASDPTPNGGQIGQLVAEYAELIAPASQERNWAELDACRWNFAPQTADKGAFFRSPASQGMSGGVFDRKLDPPGFAGFCKYIIDFCTDSRPQKNYAPNDGNPLGYGWGYLSHEAQDAAAPARPTIEYRGPEGFPTGALQFAASPFKDAQGHNTFAAVQWRVGAIGKREGEPWKYEIESVWLGPETVTPNVETHIPANVCEPSRTYRVRARYKDNTGRWSHWSAPVEFVAR